MRSITSDSFINISNQYVVADPNVGSKDSSSDMNDDEECHWEVKDFVEVKRISSKWNWDNQRWIISKGLCSWFTLLEIYINKIGKISLS
jgi:hypothetical protein